MNKTFAWVFALLLAGGARADSVDLLRDFATNVKSGRAGFTQTVTSVDGAKKKDSSGQFEFVRPNRFRFSYAKPFEQQIVADGQKVWLYDVDLNQVTVRPMAQALGATPAALLAGATLDKEFDLKAAPEAEAGSGGEGGGNGESDAMYDQAVEVVLQHRRASISLVQRHLRIGYNRAARLLEQMERAGLVSPMASNGNRDILVPKRDE